MPASGTDPATARRVEVSLGPVTGNWRRFATMYDTTAVTADLFEVTIVHGMEVADAGYTYVIVPEIDGVAGWQGIRTRLPFRLTDTPDATAFEWLGVPTKLAVCFAAGCVEWADGMYLESTAPALVVRETDGQLLIADPIRQGTLCRITIGRRDRVVKTATFDLDGSLGRTLGSNVK